VSLQRRKSSKIKLSDSDAARADAGNNPKKETLNSNLEKPQTESMRGEIVSERINFNSSSCEAVEV